MMAAAGAQAPQQVPAEPGVVVESGEGCLYVKARPQLQGCLWLRGRCQV